jgi:multimeric flavodoxin WrbA
MSGAMKEMFDRCYYPLLGALNGRPYAAIIAAGSDGHGAAAQLARIATGWRLRPVAESLIVTLGAQRAEEIAAPKTVPGAGLAAAGEVGGRLSAGIAWGIY